MYHNDLLSFPGIWPTQCNQWRINNGAIGARAPGPRAPGGPQILNKQFFLGHNH